MKKRVAVKVFKRMLRAISVIGYFEDNPSYNINTIVRAIRRVNKLKFIKDTCVFVVQDKRNEGRVKANDKQRVTTECACYQ